MVQPMASFGPDWGDRSQLFWSGQQAGAVLEMTFEVKTPGAYRAGNGSTLQGASSRLRQTGPLKLRPVEADSFRCEDQRQLLLVTCCVMAGQAAASV
jgi:hypothetical protein